MKNGDYIRFITALFSRKVVADPWALLPPPGPWIRKGVHSRSPQRGRPQDTAKHGQPGPAQDQTAETTTQRVTLAMHCGARGWMTTYMAILKN